MPTASSDAATRIDTPTPIIQFLSHVELLSLISWSMAPTIGPRCGGVVSDLRRLGERRGYTVLLPGRATLG